MGETTVERRYQMTRIAAGDYLLPSNDAQTLWRIYSYTEDGDVEYEVERGKYRKLTGTFWATAKYNGPLPLPDRIPDDFLSWDNWTTWETTLPTRAAAIKAVVDRG